MASLLRRSASLLRVPWNELAFAVRSRVRWRRGCPAISGSGVDGQFGWLAGREREHASQLAARFERELDPGTLRGAVSPLVFAENLALFERLGALTDGVALAGDRIAAADVGCGAFGYAPALQHWLARLGGGAPRPVRLRGIEIDGYGIYRDGHSRADHAERHAALAGDGVSFEVADFVRLELPPQDVVTMLFPFLSTYSLLQWGAPLHHLKPRRLLRRAVVSLRPGGLLVVVNQTKAESERLADLLAGAPVKLVRRVPFASRLVPYAERTGGRIGSLWRREPGDAAATV
ncbi:MAG: class I SAM-dependent methyltransferase [Planctomycetes bacterium]|nr:class I SAM-dependent methyltransferase [Planctomycetota bacterium]